MKNIEKIDWEKMTDLIPVITQDSSSNEVLMLGYTNKEALEITLKTGYAHYFSRSKQRIWKKGESSNHTQKIVNISLIAITTLYYLKLFKKELLVIQEENLVFLQI